MSRENKNLSFKDERSSTPSLYLLYKVPNTMDSIFLFTEEDIKDTAVEDQIEHDLIICFRAANADLGDNGVVEEVSAAVHDELLSC